MTYGRIIPLHYQLLQRENAKPRKRKATEGNPRVPDTVVLEIRRLYEIERWPMNKVFAKFPQYSETWLRNVMTGDVRSRLRVKPLK